MDPNEPTQPEQGRHVSDSDDTRPRRLPRTRLQGPPGPPAYPSDAPTQFGAGGRITDQPAYPPRTAGTQPGPGRGPRRLPSADPWSTSPPPGTYPSQFSTRGAGAPPASGRRAPRAGGAGPRLLQGLMLTMLLAAGLAFLFLALGVVGYAAVASELPAPEELQNQAFTFASSVIYDRNGNQLWELMDPVAGRRTWVPLSRVSPYVQQATIATEDRFFYQNVGVDPIAIARALYYNISEGEVVSGGSTITQQLARSVLLSPEERTQETLSRKIREAVLAVELARRYPKDKILEIYLNQIYYGNLAYGIEAASQTYFGKAATELSLAEAALLAGLPQSPAVYDPFSNPQAAKARQQVVLNLMVEAGAITPAQAAAAYEEELAYIPPRVSFAAPHFVTYVRQLLEARYGPELLYQEPGIRVVTTLDPRIQAIAEEEVTRQVSALRGKNVTNSAVVVLNVKTGEILAMVGSQDFNDESIDGQVNVALQPRQPGSAIKPLTYLAAFEQGWTPSTLIMDVPVEYSDGAGGVYRPMNYDGKFHGPVLLRNALGNSYNIPAVKTLEFIGIPALKEMASRLGVTTLTRDDYGLALTLGGGEVTLLELTGAYQAMANAGWQVPPVAILNVTDSLGRVMEEYRPPEGVPVLRPEHAYLMTHILADNQARSAAFGPDSALKLSRPAAVKTGTTTNYRDNWTIGYTPDMVVGVWVGNSDNSPMEGVSGVGGAGPIWHNVMERALEGLPVRDFIRPPGIVQLEICADSGTLPSPVCPRRSSEIFAQDQPPLGPEHDMHQVLRLDTAANCVAHEYTPLDRVVERYFQVFPPDGRAWAAQNGIEQPPDPCPAPAGVIQADITWPTAGQTVGGVISIDGVALAANFAYYVVDYGVSWGPQAFGPVAGPVYQLVEGGQLATWDTRDQPNGPYTLRLVVYDQAGSVYEDRVNIIIDNEMPTPEDTPTPEPPTQTSTPQPATDTPTPVLVTETPTPELATETPTLEVVTETPTPAPGTDTPTPTPPVTDTPTPSSTPGGPGSVTPVATPAD